MRYLRMLTNSLIGACLGSAYIVVLILYLNPRLPLSPAFASSVAAVVVFYGVHLLVLFYALIVVRQLVAAEWMSPGWISATLLAWLSAATATAGAALMWLNYRTFAGVLDPITRGRMALGTSALAAGAVFSIAVALSGVGIRRRGGWGKAGLVLATTAFSVLAPLVIRGWGGQATAGGRVPSGSMMADERVPLDEKTGRVTLILIDGASLDFVSPAAADGRLPNFGRMLDAGAGMHLASLVPTAPGPVWSAAATGKLPYKNGVRSPAFYRAGNSSAVFELLPVYCFAHALVRFGVLHDEPHTVGSPIARPLWQIVGSLGGSVAVVGWPLTHPAQPVNGVLVSDQFHRTRDSSLALDDASAVYPPSLLPIARRSLMAALDEGAADLLRAGIGIAGEPPEEATRTPSAADRVYDRLVVELTREGRPGLTAVRYRGLDAVGHLFLRYAQPRDFGDVSDEERQRFGHVLEQYYQFLDTVVGRALASLGPDDLLLVVSGFGMDPMSMGKRLVNRAFGDTAVTATHEAAPDGFLLAYGGAVKPGRVPRGSVLDLTPTVLYFLGLPVGRDMDGDARTDLFQQPFTEANPITFIPTYGR